MGIVVDRNNIELLNAITELARYLGEEPLAIAANCGNSFYLVAEEWEKDAPETGEEIHRFYQKAKSYLYNLVFANYGIPHQTAWRKLAREIAREGDRVLDLGAGIGSTLLEVSAATRVHADVGGILMDYARWRYADRGINVEMSPLPEDYLYCNPMSDQKSFDFVVCTEVIEHVLEPELLVEYLAWHTKIGGRVLATVSFEDDHGLFPCHLNTNKYTNEDFIRDVFPRCGLERESEWLFVRAR